MDGVAVEKERCQSVRQTTMAWLLGIDRSQFATWGDAPRNGDGSYSIPAVVAWYLRTKIVQGADGAELLEGGDSPGLERYRLAKAELAELEVAEQRREVLPRVEVRTALGQIASIFRRAGSQLRKKHGEAAWTILDHAIDDCERYVESAFGDEGDGQ